MAKKVPEHRDMLGRLITTDSCVAFPDGNHLKIGKVNKLNPKMVRIRGAKTRYDCNKYPQDVVIVDGPEVTMYLMKIMSTR